MAPYLLMAVGMNNSPWSTIQFYAVPTISRLLKITDLLCKRALQKSLYSAKETSNLKGPTNRSHPISRFCATLSQLSVCCVPPYHNCLYVVCHPITTVCALIQPRLHNELLLMLRSSTNEPVFCKRALQMSLYSAKETSNLKVPTIQPRLHNELQLMLRTFRSYGVATIISSLQL